MGEVVLAGDGAHEDPVLLLVVSHALSVAVITCHTTHLGTGGGRSRETGGGLPTRQGGVATMAPATPLVELLEARTRDGVPHAGALAAPDPPSGPAPRFDAV